MHTIMNEFTNIRGLLFMGLITSLAIAPTLRPSSGQLHVPPGATPPAAAPASTKPTLNLVVLLDNGSEVERAREGSMDALVRELNDALEQERYLRPHHYAVIASVSLLHALALIEHKTGRGIMKNLGDHWNVYLGDGDESLVMLVPRACSCAAELVPETGRSLSDVDMKTFFLDERYASCVCSCTSLERIVPKKPNKHVVLSGHGSIVHANVASMDSGGAGHFFTFLANNNTISLTLLSCYADAVIDDVKDRIHVDISGRCSAAPGLDAPRPTYPFHLAVNSLTDETTFGPEGSRHFIDFFGNLVHPRDMGAAVKKAAMCLYRATNTWRILSFPSYARPGPRSFLRAIPSNDVRAVTSLSLKALIVSHGLTHSKERLMQRINMSKRTLATLLADFDDYEHAAQVLPKGAAELSALGAKIGKEKAVMEGLMARLDECSAKIRPPLPRLMLTKMVALFYPVDMRGITIDIPAHSTTSMVFSKISGPAYHILGTVKGFLSADALFSIFLPWAATKMAKAPVRHFIGASCKAWFVEKCATAVPPRRRLAGVAIFKPRGTEIATRDRAHNALVVYRDTDDAYCYCIGEYSLVPNAPLVTEKIGKIAYFSSIKTFAEKATPSHRSIYRASGGTYTVDDARRAFAEWLAYAGYDESAYTAADVHRALDDISSVAILSEESREYAVAAMARAIAARRVFKPQDAEYCARRLPPLYFKNKFHLADPLARAFVEAGLLRQAFLVAARLVAAESKNGGVRARGLDLVRFIALQSRPELILTSLSSLAFNKECAIYHERLCTELVESMATLESRESLCRTITKHLFQGPSNSYTIVMIGAALANVGLLNTILCNRALGAILARAVEDELGGASNAVALSVRKELVKHPLWPTSHECALRQKSAARPTAPLCDAELHAVYKRRKFS